MAKKIHQSFTNRFSCVHLVAGGGVIIHGNVGEDVEDHATHGFLKQQTLFTESLKMCLPRPKTRTKSMFTRLARRLHVNERHFWQMITYSVRLDFRIGQMS